MSMHLKVVSVETVDALPCVVLTTDSRRILFDCGEGTQRLCVEHRVRFGKLDAVCLTRFAPEVLGGLPGLVLTASDSGRGELAILAPRPFSQYWRCTSFFLYRPNFTMPCWELGTVGQGQGQGQEQGLCSHSMLRNDAVSYSSTSTNTNTSGSGSGSGSGSDVNSAGSSGDSSNAPGAGPAKPKVAVACSQSAGTVTHSWDDVAIISAPFCLLVPPSNTDAETDNNTGGSCERGGSVATTAVTYLCRTPQLPGKFDVTRAKQLGVPTGPLFGVLKGGKTVRVPAPTDPAVEALWAEAGVVVDTGTGTGEILPSMVVGPSDPSAVVVIAPALDAHEVEAEAHDARTEANIASFTDLQVWQPYRSGSDHGTHGRVVCVVHFSSERLVRGSGSYRAWMDTMGPHCTHLILGRRTPSPTTTTTTMNTAPAPTNNTSFLASTMYCTKLRSVRSTLFPHMPLPPLPPVTDGSSRALGAGAGAVVGGRSSAGVSTHQSKHVQLCDPLVEFHLLPVRRRGLCFSERARAVAAAHEAVDGYWERVQAETKVDQCLDAAAQEREAYLSRRRQLAQGVVREVQGGEAMDTSSVESGESANILQQQRLQQESAIERHGDSEVWMLGTASAIPSKYRNVSGIALLVAPCNMEPGRGGDGNGDGDHGVVSTSITEASRIVLLDVGEGSWNHMLKIAYSRKVQEQEALGGYGAAHNAKAGAVVADVLQEVAFSLTARVRLIWISHPHADHHLGLLGLLTRKARAMQVAAVRLRELELRARSEGGGTGDAWVGEVDLLKLQLQPIVLVAPPSILSFLLQYSEITDGAFDCRSVVGAYIPISSRQADPTDDCSAVGDSFWRRAMQEAHDAKRAARVTSMLHAAPAPSSVAVVRSFEGRPVDDRPAGSSGGAGSTEFSRYYYHYHYRKLQQRKKQREAANASVGTGTDTTADGSIQTLQDAAASTSSSRAPSPHSDEDADDATRVEGGVSLKVPPWAQADALSGGGDSYLSQFSATVRQHTAAANAVLASLGVSALSNVRVVHCPQSYAVSLSLLPPAPTSATTGSSSAHPLKIVYSGDTRPCPALTALAQGATLLIHEATFEDSMQADALAKLHSTVSEAIQTGRDAGVFFTLLTHFSQRYATLPALPEPAVVPSGAASTVGAVPAARLSVLPAFDFMTLRLADLPWCSALTPVFYEALSLENEGEGEEDGEDAEGTGSGSGSGFAGVTAAASGKGTGTGAGRGKRGLEAAIPTASHTGSSTTSSSGSGNNKKSFRKAMWDEKRVHHADVDAGAGTGAAGVQTSGTGHLEMLRCPCCGDMGPVGVGIGMDTGGGGGVGLEGNALPMEDASDGAMMCMLCTKKGRAVKN